MTDQTVRYDNPVTYIHIWTHAILGPVSSHNSTLAQTRACIFVARTWHNLKLKSSVNGLFQLYNSSYTECSVASFIVKREIQFLKKFLLVSHKANPLAWLGLLLQNCCRLQGSVLMEMLWERPCSNRRVSRHLRRGGAGRSWTPHTLTLNWKRATSYSLVQLVQVRLLSTLS